MDTHTPAPPPLDDDTIARWLDGEFDVERRAAIEAQLGTDPKEWLRIRAMGAVLHPGPPIVSATTAETWAQQIVLQTPIKGAHTTAASDRSNVRTRAAWPTSDSPRLGMIATIVSCLCIALMIGYVAYPNVSRVYATAEGQYAVVQMPNGMRAVLGNATTLTITSARSGQRGTPMTANLTGQALFFVNAHAHTPFVVHTTNASTQVLGTTFMVRRYARDHMTHVAVVDGRVALQGLLQGLFQGRDVATRTVLDAHTVGTVDDSGHVQATPASTVDDYTSWTAGQLVFHDTPVRDIATELGRAYGVDIRVSDSTLARQAFSWSVQVSRRSLHGVLATLTDALNAHVTWTGDTVTLAPGANASRSAPRTHTFNLLENSYGR